MNKIGIGIHAGCGTPAPTLLPEQTWTEALILAPYNTLGMYRGWIMAYGRIIVATHAEEHVMGHVKWQA